MNTRTRVEPRTLPIPTMITLTALTLTGTSVPIAHSAEPTIIRPILISSTPAPLVQPKTTGLGAASVKNRAAATAESISELRAMTSFTWEQISKLFGVSRRTVHLWAAGGNMTASHQEHLAGVLRQAKEIRSSSPAEERMQLLALLDQHRSAHASRDSDINRPAATYATEA